MRTIELVGPRDLALRALVPESRRERMRGLRNLPPLGPDEALLLERARSVHTFGLHGPIGVALLDRGFVVRDVRLIPPGRVVLPRRGVRHVLELMPGLDLRLGDRLAIR